MPSQTRFLVDYFDRATLSGPQSGMAVRDMNLRRDGRIGIFQHPDSEIAFPVQEIKAPASLSFGIGILESVWPRMQSPVEFSIVLRDESGGETELFRKSIDPRHNPDERCWLDYEIAVPAPDTPVRIVLKTRVGKRKGSAWCWAAWANPMLAKAGSGPSIQRAQRLQPLVLLVTSDALRMDHVGCYGSAVSTPNIDRLAAEGVLFEHARTQSSVSLGSYASLLASRSPLTHKITGEWGRFPENLLSLPTQFGAWGYHTIIAASEAELDDREAGFSSFFAERIPCVGTPAQAGEVTVRRVIERLGELPDKPVFLWIQLFDTHPPLLGRGEFGSRYYQDDPTEARNSHLEGKIKNIRGVESLADILASLARLKAGEQQASITVRLRGTADCLLGRSRSGPDLASHIRAAPRKFTRNLELHPFALWLDAEVHRLEHAEPASPALIAWLQDLLPFLREIESEITAWLAGVVDYRFALAQYKASVSYMDKQVGRLRDGLEHLGFDSQTTWVFSSPHGEALGESETYFHHHLLHESVLRVPLILRPAKALTADTAYTPGKRIGGIMDLIDIYPTLLDALRLPQPETLEGSSRWPEVISGQRIPPHPSYSVDRNGVALSVASETHKYWLCTAPHSVTASRGYRTDEAHFFSISGTEEVECGNERSEEMQQLGDRLSEWKSRQ